MENLPVTELLTLAMFIAGAGAIAGFLAGVFGIGGGAILVPVFFQVFGWAGVDDGVRMHLAVGTSLAIIVPTSLRSFAAHRQRGAVDMQLLRGWVVAVPVGVVLASGVIAFISGEGLRLVFAVIAIGVALRLIFNRESWQLSGDIPQNPVRFVVGSIIGFLSTLMGIGGGVMNNTFMTLYGRSIHQAVATSSGTGVLISIPGMVGAIWAGWGIAGLPYGSLGYVNLIGFALVIPITLLVAPYGAMVAHKLSKRTLEVAFGGFLILVAVRFFISVL